VQCSLNKRLEHQGMLLIRFMSWTKGSAYLDKLAVKTTISKWLYIISQNSKTPGLRSTNTVHYLPSISIERVISAGVGWGLKDEWTRVSSRSRIRVLRPFLFGGCGPSNGMNYLVELTCVWSFWKSILVVPVEGYLGTYVIMLKVQLSEIVYPPSFYNHCP
jgi:hypothetical protein